MVKQLVGKFQLLNLIAELAMARSYSQQSISQFFGKSATVTSASSTTIVSSISTPSVTSMATQVVPISSSGPTLLISSILLYSTTLNSDVAMTLVALDLSNQPVDFSFQQRKFGEVHPFHATWFKKWPWIHYDQVHDTASWFVCVKASKLANLKVCASKGGDAFLKLFFWLEECMWRKAWGLDNARTFQHT